jgi:hypothetical protein
VLKFKTKVVYRTNETRKEYRLHIELMCYKITANSKIILLKETKLYLYDVKKSLAGHSDRAV